MANYAFLDVQNTDSTTRQILNFEIDWIKMFLFLQEEKKCKEIFFYSGFIKNDKAFLNLIGKLESLGCVNRSKEIHVYKNNDIIINIICPKCKNSFSQNINKGFNSKANCDVDLTVDVMQNLGQGNKIYLFSGDGDFEYLIKTAVKNQTKIVIVSSPKKIRKGPRYFSSRLSTKLRNLTKEYPFSVIFEDINNYHYKIAK